MCHGRKGSRCLSLRRRQIGRGSGVSRARSVRTGYGFAVTERGTGQAGGSFNQTAAPCARATARPRAGSGRTVRPGDRCDVRRRGVRGGRRPAVVLVRRGGDDIRLDSDGLRTVPADPQRRCGARPLLPLDARLDRDLPRNRILVRLFSCLAFGIVAAGVVVVAKQFSTRTVAVCAGIVFAILPRVTWAGVEARSYALTAAAAVWLTVSVVAAARRNARALWTLYGLALVLSTLLNVFVVLMVLVHAVVVAVVAEKRAPVVWWAATSTAALLFVAPFLAFCHTQIAQVRWISPIKPGTVVEIAQEQSTRVSRSRCWRAWSWRLHWSCGARGGPRRCNSRSSR
jgi:hypothetical protein